MEVGICYSAAKASELAVCNIRFIEENVQGFLVPREGDDAFAPNRKWAESCPFPIRAANCFLPGALECTGPSIDVDAILAYARTAFARANEVGIRDIVFGSGGLHQVNGGWPMAKAREQFLDILRHLGPLAQEEDITVAVEPLSTKECNFINSVADGAALVKDCDHPNIRLLADLYHMGVDGEKPSELSRYSKLLHHVHVAEIKDRGAPGHLDDSLRPYLEALVASGYRGRVSLECSGSSPDELAAGVEYLRKYLG